MILSRYATRLTLYGERNMTNNKPFRDTKGDHPGSKRDARKCASMSAGRYTSYAPRQYHGDRPYSPSKAALKHRERFEADCSNTI